VPVGVYLYPISFLGKNSVKIFTRLRIIVGGVVFYVVRVISKESMRLVLPRARVIFICTLFNNAVSITRRFDNSWASWCNAWHLNYCPRDETQIALLCLPLVLAFFPIACSRFVD
jgi:hypothetical protein